MTHAGDTEGGFHAMVEGQGAFMSASSHEETGISFMGYPGTWWGQGPLLGLPRSGFTVARSPCRIAILSLPLLRRRLSEVPADWEAISLVWSDLFLMAAGAQTDLLIPGHLPRLAAAILRLGGNRHRRFPVDAPQTFLLTQEDLAGAIGLARNAAGRLLRQLEAQGLVDARYGRITILDRAGLSRLVGR
ncbi:MAG: Crp/Fnr family transcriptional regulator [Sphingomonadaceae bacterium]